MAPTFFVGENDMDRCPRCRSWKLTDTLKGVECQNCLEEFIEEVAEEPMSQIESTQAPIILQLQASESAGDAIETREMETVEQPTWYQQQSDSYRQGHRSSTRAFQKKRLEAGLCQRCGKRRDGPYAAYCNACALKQRESSRKRAQSKKRGGDWAGRPALVEDIKPVELGPWSIPADGA
jgi:glutaredoxin